MEQGQPQPDKMFTRSFVLILIANFFLFVNFQMLPSSLPVYAASIGTDESLVGLISLALTITALIARPLSGLAVDRWGRKGFMIGGAAGMVVTTAAYGFSPAFAALLAIRFVQGLAWGVCDTAITTVLSDTLPRKRFGEGMGYFGLSISVAMAIGPALGLAVLDRFGMTAVASVATAAIVIVLVLSLFFAYPKIEPQPDGQRRMFFEKGALVPAIIIFFMMGAHGAVVTYLPLTAASRGIGAGAGLFFTVFAIAAIVCRLFIGKLIDRKGFAIPGTIGIACMLIAIVILAFAPSLPVVLFAAVFYGVGHGTSQTTFQAYSVLNSPPWRRGVANATFMFGFDAGIGVGSMLSGAFVAALGFGGMFLGIACMPVCAFVIFMVSESRRRAKAAS